MNTSPEESKTLKKRLSTMFCAAWRAIRKFIYSPTLSELDDVNSTTAQLLYADTINPSTGTDRSQQAPRGLPLYLITLDQRWRAHGQFHNWAGVPGEHNQRREEILSFKPKNLGR